MGSPRLGFEREVAPEGKRGSVPWCSLKDAVTHGGEEHPGQEVPVPELLSNHQGEETWGFYDQRQGHGRAGGRRVEAGREVSGSPKRRVGRALEDKGLRLGGGPQGRRRSQSGGVGVGDALGSAYSCLVCPSLPPGGVLKDSVASPSETGPEGRATLSTQCERAGLCHPPDRAPLMRGPQRVSKRNSQRCGH